MSTDCCIDKLGLPYNAKRNKSLLLRFSYNRRLLAQQRFKAARQLMNSRLKRPLTTLRSSRSCNLAPPASVRLLRIQIRYSAVTQPALVSVFFNHFASSRYAQASGSRHL
ncbi:hypothetical protein D3C78_1345360 [compost metagenome]